MVKTPQLTVSSSDMLLRGIYLLRLSLFKMDGVSSVHFDFTVTLKAYCVTPGFTLPTLSLYRYQIIDPFVTFNYSLGPIANNLCKFEVLLTNQDFSPVDASIFSLNQL